MTNKQTTKIKAYFQQVKKAQNEQVKRECLLVLLMDLFGEMPEAKIIIDELTSGAEKPLNKIVKSGKKSDFGRVDTQYRSMIIEWEKDLSRTGEHAKGQLTEYLSGNWNSGENYNFTLIASDCITWKIYIPDVSAIDFSKDITADEIKLVERDTFILSEKTFADFYYFLDATIFNIEKKRPSLKAIKEHFSNGSNTFLSVTASLERLFQKKKNDPAVKVAFEQWSRFLSIAYDKFDGHEKVFITHTYLSIFAKLLTYEILTKDDFIDESELKAIIDGKIFEKLNIRNFTDNDFFHWVSDKQILKEILPALRQITSEFDLFDFTNIDEDILKGVYQDLIDRDTRHALGEYYTPDWLCEYIIEQLDITASSKILDPSCGSGSFLRAAINSLIDSDVNLSANEICAQVVGFDIHPLSVQIAKATTLITLRDKIKESKKPVSLSVFLANTLLTPVAKDNLDFFGESFDILVDKEKISINTRLFDNPYRFERAVIVAEDLAQLTNGQANMDRMNFNQTLKLKLDEELNEIFVVCIYDLYCAFKKAKEEGRDSIWEFIVRNLYKPAFLNQSFDYVVGNPPWFTLKDIRNSDYQNELTAKAKDTGTWPSKSANATHLEIAAVFLAHCTEYFLKKKGKLAFVLPRSFFSSEHHHNTRAGKVKNVKITEIWDLEKVAPLFRVPSCVLFTERHHGKSKTEIPKSGRLGQVIAGKLDDHNGNLDAVRSKLDFEKTNFYYKIMGNSSAFSTSKTIKNEGINYYKDLFKQGATIVPRNLYFIENSQPTKKITDDVIFHTKTSNNANKNAKNPYKGHILEGNISGSFVYLTALAENILPFHLYEPQLVLLPAQFRSQEHLEMLSSKDLIERAELETATWCQRAEQILESNKTAKSKNMSNLGRLDYASGLTKQNFVFDNLVLYTASGKDANSTVVKRSELELNFVADHKAYLFGTHSEDEAYFLSAFFNSQYANKKIKDFQSRGSFGPRDVHKKILEVGLPEFDAKDDGHLEISKISKSSHEKVIKFMNKQDLPQNLPGNLLGRTRLKIREYLKKEFREIDRLLKQINKVSR